MKDTDCREFLDWALPRLGFRRAGFRRVLRKIERRMAAGGILLVGRNERLPVAATGFVEDHTAPSAYRYRGPA